MYVVEIVHLFPWKCNQATSRSRSITLQNESEDEIHVHTVFHTGTLDFYTVVLWTIASSLNKEVTLSTTICFRCIHVTNLRVIDQLLKQGANCSTMYCSQVMLFLKPQNGFMSIVDVLWKRCKSRLTCTGNGFYVNDIRQRWWIDSLKFRNFDLSKVEFILCSELCIQTGCGLNIPENQTFKNGKTHLARAWLSSSKIDWRQKDGDYQ